MRRFTAIVIAILVAVFAFTSIVSASVRVKGYFRKDGTYVQPHYRSNPDGNPYNNWSYPGNTNPYTGETAPGNPDTYLKNYYKDSYTSPSYSPNPIYNGFTNQAVYHVYQYDKYLQSFKDLSYAMDYAEKWDHAKVLSGTTNIVMWHNYPYNVYQSDKYLNSFLSLYNAINYANRWENSKVVDGLSQKVIWDSF